ncbi:MAG: hypothetical protein HYV55_02380 [Parcubacteria group bacterium]|nr:hypothetical protein [Parcubacteria group bacterium]
MKTVFFGLIVLSFFSSPLLGFAAPLSNAGFLQGGIWYSKDPFFAGDTVRVYAALFNSGNEDIAGTVEFLDNKKSLGAADFFVERGGKFTQVWVDWKATEGEHLVEAVITKASVIRVGGSPVAIELQQTRAQESLRQVQQDTDGDGVGNANDSDDDNDGMSDVQEIKQGTNPLVPSVPVAQNQEENVASSEQQKTSITDTIIALLPDTVEKPASEIHAAVKDLLAPVKEQVERKQEEAVQQLRALEENPEATQAEKTKASVYLASLSAASFVLKTEIILYVFVLFLGYVFLKALVRRVFKR